MRGSQSDRPFLAALAAMGVMYLFLIVIMLVADAWYAVDSVSPEMLREIFADDEIRDSIKLTLWSCTITAILSVIVAVPTGYLLSRYQFRGKLRKHSLDARKPGSPGA